VYSLVLGFLEIVFGTSREVSKRKHEYADIVWDIMLNNHFFRSASTREGRCQCAWRRMWICPCCC
jgi:hypothetical protein